MTKLLVSDLFANCMKLPCFKGLLAIEGCKAKEAVACANEFGCFVTDQLRKMWRFVGYPIEHLMFNPGPFGSARILMHECRRTWEANHKDVVGPIAIKVVHPIKKVIGITFTILRLGWIELGTLLVFRSGVPMWTIHNVVDLVAVDVTDADTFRIVRIGDRSHLELMKRWRFRRLCLSNWNKA